MSEFYSHIKQYNEKRGKSAQVTPGSNQAPPLELSGYVHQFEPTPVPNDFTSAKDAWLTSDGGSSSYEAARNYYDKSRSVFHQQMSQSGLDSETFHRARRELKDVANKTPNPLLAGSIRHFLGFANSEVSTNMGFLNSHVIDQKNPMEKIMGGFYEAKGNEWFKENHGSQDVSLHAFEKGVFTGKGKGIGFSPDFLGNTKNRKTISKMLSSHITKTMSEDEIRGLAEEVGLSDKSDKRDIATALGEHLASNYHKPGAIAQRYHGMVSTPEMPLTAGLLYTEAMRKGNAQAEHNPVNKLQATHNKLYDNAMTDALKFLGGSKSRVPSHSKRLRDAARHLGKTTYTHADDTKKGRVSASVVDLGVLGLAGAVASTGHYLSGDANGENKKHVDSMKDVIETATGTKLPVVRLSRLIEQAAPLDNIHGRMSPFIYDSLAGEGHVQKGMTGYQDQEGKDVSHKQAFVKEFNDYVNSTSGIVKPMGISHRYSSASWGHRSRLDSSVDIQQAKADNSAYNKRADEVLEAYKSGNLQNMSPETELAFYQQAKRVWNRNSFKKFAARMGKEQGVSSGEMEKRLQSAGFVYEKQKTPEHAADIEATTSKGVADSAVRMQKEVEDIRTKEASKPTTAENVSRWQESREQRKQAHFELSQEAQRFRVNTSPKDKRQKEIMGYTKDIASRISGINDEKRRKENAGVDKNEIDEEYHTDVHHVLNAFADFASKSGFNIDELMGNEIVTGEAAKKTKWQKSLDNVVDMVKARKRFLQEAGENSSVSAIIKEFAKAQSGPTKKVFPSTIRYAIQKRLYGNKN